MNQVQRDAESKNNNINNNRKRSQIQQIANSPSSSFPNSRSILSRAAKETQINDRNISSPISTPFRNFALSTIRSDLMNSDEQTTLNLSSCHNQNGLLSGTFNAAINFSTQNANSKQNLETVRDEYYQNNFYHQNYTLANSNSPKVTLSQFDSNTSLSNVKGYVVPPLKLQQVQSNYTNQLESVESFDMGTGSKNVQLNHTLSSKMNSKEYNNNLSFLYLNQIQRTASAQRTHIEDTINTHNLGVAINGFLTERSTSNTKQFSSKSRGILKSNNNNSHLQQQSQQQLQRQQSKERNEGLQINKNMFKTTLEYKLEKFKLKNENQRGSLRQIKMTKENGEDSSQQLEYQCLTERRLSQRTQIIRTTNHNNSDRSKENLINRCFSPIRSPNHQNILNSTSQQWQNSQTNQKQNQTVKFNDNTLSQEDFEEISLRQISSLNNIPTINHSDQKRTSQLKLNQGQSSSYQSQKQQFNSQTSHSKNTQKQSNSQKPPSQNKYPTLQSNIMKREKQNIIQNSNSNINIKQPHKINPNNNINNNRNTNNNNNNNIKNNNNNNNENNVNNRENPSSNICDVSVANNEQLNKKQIGDCKQNQIKNPYRKGYFLDEPLVTKFRTEGDLYSQAINPRIKQKINPFSQQLDQTSELERNDSKKITQTVPNFDMAFGKKSKNVLVTAMKAMQKQNEKLNILAEFIARQNGLESKKRLQNGIGLNQEKQSEALAFWKQLKESIYAKSNIEMVYKKNRFEESAIQGYMEVVEKLNGLNCREGESMQDYNEIEMELQTLLDVLMPMKKVSYLFLISLQTVIGQFHFNCGNIYSAIKYLLKAKTMANAHKSYKQKMRIHKQLGISYKLINHFPQAKSHFLKMLTLAWLLNDRDAELNSYDQLGIIFYYFSEIGIASRLHQRLCLDITEDDNSKTKQSALQNYQQTQKYHHQQNNLDGLAQRESPANIPLSNRSSKNNQNKDITNKNDANESNDRVDDLFSDSSEEEPDYYVREMIQLDIAKEEDEKQEKIREEKRDNSSRNIKLRYSKLMQSRQDNKEQEEMYQRILKTRQFSENAETDKKKKNPPILISHLSRNRNSNNYKETSVKEHQYFHLKKYNQQIARNNSNNQYLENASNTGYSQNMLKTNSEFNPQDEQTPQSLIFISNSDQQQTQQTLQNELDNSKATPFRFTVPHTAFKSMIKSMDTVKKQILLLLNNIERHESQQCNVTSVSRKNILHLF